MQEIVDQQIEINFYCNKKLVSLLFLAIQKCCISLSVSIFFKKKKKKKDPSIRHSIKALIALVGRLSVGWENLLSEREL